MEFPDPKPPIWAELGRFGRFNLQTSPKKNREIQHLKLLKKGVPFKAPFPSQPIASPQNQLATFTYLGLPRRLATKVQPKRLKITNLQILKKKHLGGFLGVP